MQEAIRRSKNIKRAVEYERKLLDVQLLIHRVTGDREVQVMNWMLDEKSQRWIAKVMGLSHTHVQNIKDSIVEQMMG